MKEGQPKTERGRQEGNGNEREACVYAYNHVLFVHIRNHLISAMFDESGSYCVTFNRQNFSLITSSPQVLPM